MKNYLVIGASSGIGERLAHNLASSGNQVYGTYYSKSVTSSDLGIEYHPMNVLEEKLNFDFLPDDLDGIVYCPGTINLKPFARIKPEEFISDFDLQVVGAIKVLQTVLSKLKAAERASIVLFSTIAVQTGFNFHTQVAVSKGAIEGLTRSLAAELAPKIRVNCIAPSITDTPLASRILGSEDKKESNAQRHPLKQIGKPQNIADMAQFLLSEKSSWVTGQIFHVDGGLSTLKI